MRKKWIGFVAVGLLVLAGCQADLQPAATQALSVPSIQPSSTAAPSEGKASPVPTVTAAASVPAAPSPFAAPTQAVCDDPQSRLEAGTVSDATYGTGSVQVYLPPCYSAAAQRGYAVLYLLHGSNTDNTQWIQMGVASTADRLIRSGQAPAFLIVLPREEFYLQDPDKSTFGNWIIHALVPWVDKNYRTCAERACRAIGGLSRGGSWAFRIGLLDWQEFSAVGMDSAVPFSNDLAKSQAVFSQLSPAQQPRFYIDIGKEDVSVPWALNTVETLTQLRVTNEWHLSDGAHNRAYWRSHLEEYLRWYTATWR